MFLSNPFNKAFGLDIDDLSLTILQLKRHHPFQQPAYYTVENIRSSNLPPGCIVNGEIEQPEIVRRKILHLLGEDKTYKQLGSPWVVANLPENKTFLKVITINNPAEDLMPEDIEYHAAKHLPFELEQTYLDWQILRSDAESTDLLVGAAPKNVADSYTYLLEAAGLNPLALELEALALTRALITRDKDYTGQARAILNLNQTRSSLVIFDKGSVQFSSSIPFSFEIMATAVAQGMKISSEQAAKMLNEYGITYNKEKPKYMKIVDDMVSELIGKIKQSVSFYQDHFEETNPITHITMGGSLSNLANLDSILSQKLKISAAPGNVWKNISSEKVTEEKKIKGLGLTMAIGLALRAVHNPLDETSLL